MRAFNRRGFSRDTVRWLAHMRFVGSCTSPLAFPAFNKAARMWPSEFPWSRFVRAWEASFSEAFPCQ